MGVERILWLLPFLVTFESLCRWRVRLVHTKVQRVSQSDAQRKLLWFITSDVCLKLTNEVAEARALPKQSGEHGHPRGEDNFIVCDLVSSVFICVCSCTYSNA